MPQPFKSAVMTNGGIALLTKAQSGQCNIEFTQIKTGNGIYTDAEKTLDSLQKMTELKSHKNSYDLSNITIFNNQSVKVTALITNQDPVTKEALVTDGYYINEMGLYAKESGGEDSTEILYSIAVIDVENGDFMPPYNGYNPAQIIQDYFATVDNSMEVIVNFSGAAMLAEDAKVLFDDVNDKIVSLQEKIERTKILWSGYAIPGTTITFNVPKECFHNSENTLTLVIEGYIYNKGYLFVSDGVAMVTLSFNEGSHDFPYTPYTYNGGPFMYVAGAEVIGDGNLAATGFKVSAKKVADTRYATCDVKNDTLIENGFIITCISSYVPNEA